MTKPTVESQTLKIGNIRKQFLSQTALKEINLEIKKGEFFSLLGPSGCGKTTLLRIIAGFETATSGTITLGDKRIDTLSPQERPFNMVFQKYALFPHLTVFENVAFGLKIKKKSTQEIKDAVHDSLSLVGLSKFAQRYPETLSGGQAQRIALARALVNRPEVLLLDEPLSALDQKMREHMQVELRGLQKKLGITFIFVTHDQEEAMIMSDRIGVMNHGVLEEVNTPEELYENPKTLFTAQFVGQMCELKGQIIERQSALATIELSQQHRIKGKLLKEPDSPASLIYIRPENIQISASNPNLSNFNTLKGQVTNTIFRGDQSEICVSIDDKLSMRVMIDSGLKDIKVDQSVYLSFDPEETLVFGE